MATGLGQLPRLCVNALALAARRYPRIAINKPPSESEAAKLAKPRLLRGWFQAEFREVIEKESKAGNPMFEVLLAVFDGAGDEREFRDWLTTSERGLLRLRHACAALGPDGLAQFDLKIFLDIAPPAYVLVVFMFEAATTPVAAAQPDPNRAAPGRIGQVRPHAHRLRSEPR